MKVKKDKGILEEKPLEKYLDLNGLSKYLVFDRVQWNVIHVVDSTM